MIDSGASLAPAEFTPKTINTDDLDIPAFLRQYKKLGQA